MCWSILLISLCETAKEDAVQVKKRTERAAEKKREAEGDASPDQFLGGVLASTNNSSNADRQDSEQKCFDKLWFANAAWATPVLKDALTFAASTEPRSEEVLSSVIDRCFDSCAPTKDDLSSKFALHVWPSLKSRGWKAEVLADGPDAGKTVYKYDSKEVS
jgi:hypothetical protein